MRYLAFMGILVLAVVVFNVVCWSLIKEQSRKEAEYQNWVKTFEQRGEQAGLAQRRKDQATGDWSAEYFESEYKGTLDRFRKQPPGYPVKAKDKSTLDDTQRAYEDGFERGYLDIQNGRYMAPNISINKARELERREQERERELQRLNEESAKQLESLGIKLPPR